MKIDTTSTDRCAKDKLNLSKFQIVHINSICSRYMHIPWKVYRNVNPIQQFPYILYNYFMKKREENIWHYCFILSGVASPTI